MRAHNPLNPLNGPEFTLYRLFDSADHLLYVGVTVNPFRRLAEHHNTKPWWPDVATIRLEYHPDISDALAAEARAAKDEQPRHNERLVPLPSAPPSLKAHRLRLAARCPEAFTVSALARRLGVTEASLRAWEGGRNRPSQRHLRALALELGVKPEELLTGPVEAPEGQARLFAS